MDEKKYLRVESHINEIEAFFYSFTIQYHSQVYLTSKNFSM